MRSPNEPSSRKGEPMPRKIDKELEQYRQLMTVPSTFEDGFSASSFVGVLFVALIMVPGALYMELLAGMGVGAAAQWVTVILFIEVAKRANAKLSRPQLFVLFYMSGSIVGQAVYGNLLWNQFLVHSDAAVSQGLSSLFPRWYAPTDPSAYDHRTFFQAAWLPALGLFAFRQFFGKLDNTVLGYGLFRLTSDVEKLPFPLAPIGAQGITALADDLDGKAKTERSWRWRVFSIGAALGMVFGALYMALPTLTGAFFPNNTWTMFPIPFVDWTDLTKGYLPAVATGLTFDLGLVILGMVLPYYAMVGSFVGLVATMIMNPILYKAGVLNSWIPGDLTVDTMFKNYLDLYFSFGIGLSLAVAVIGFLAIFRIRRDRRERTAAEQDLPTTRPGRGDIPNRFILISYLTSTSVYILMCGYLIDWHPGVMAVLFLFGFLYTPLISYVTARLEGLAGQVVEIPFIRELAFILSGYRGLAVWFIPVPITNYGVQTVFYRQAELTGTKFTSLWKAEVFLFPVIILATVAFSSFIWGLAEIPSSVYPYAQKLWELNAKNQLLIYASTTGEYSQFQEALSGLKVLIGFGTGLVVFGALSAFSAPVTLLYGLVRGIGQTYPHSVLPQFVGALLGRFYFEKKLGLRWREYIPVLFAGYACGVGLITMLSIGLVFLFKATNSLPY
jgi:hypothetical protein